ncbi:efflux RND transporter permease subunit [Haladaptatus sp. NG-WS-4]
MVIDRLAAIVTKRSRLVIVVLFVLSLAVGSGVSNLGQSSSLDQFQVDSTASQKLDYIESNFSTGNDDRTTVQVVVRGDDVLSKASLLRTLELQRTFRDDETVGPTLASNTSSVGVANAVALAAMRAERRSPSDGANGRVPPTEDATTDEGPSLDAQIDQLRSMNQSEIDTVLTMVLADGGGRDDALVFMPTEYEPGTTTANARMFVVFQTTTSDVGGLSDASDRLVESQLAMQSLTAERLGDDAFVFGLGIVTDEVGRSMGDSFTVITPLALLFVLVTLAVAYRDLLDILLGLLGIGLVLVWMAGFMGWAGIAFNQMLIAVPILLIGLSIDYAIHVFMRHRETRETHADASARESMDATLRGVGVALVWVTATTAIGFLSNLSSSVPPIRDFGVVSAAGIVSTLFVFGVLIPASKVELDAFLEGRGFDRRKRAFGTGGGALTRILSVGTFAARKAPVVVLVVALLVGAGGAYSATKIDTSFRQEDFIAEDPPQWMDSLPDPFRPGEYHVRQNVQFVNDHFVQMRDTTRAQILVEGDVTDPQTLERLHRAQERASGSSTTVTLADGGSRIASPLTLVETIAARNESFADVVERADTDGNGVPDQNLDRVYDALFAAAPEGAAEVVHREDGEYRALRMAVSVRGNADVRDVTAEMRAASETVSGDGLTATATGQPVLTAVVQARLLQTLVTTLVLTLVAVLGFLAIAYRLREGYATLGLVTVFPVLVSLAWTLGTMYLLGIPFNSETAMITGLAIGLGVDYAIHMSERYGMELDRNDPEEALAVSVTGTGGALLGSAVTTAGGFGVLAFALVPSLQRFGIVTALSIVYAFVATVLVLPSVLRLWTRYVA